MCSFLAHLNWEAKSFRRVVGQNITLKWNTTYSIYRYFFGWSLQLTWFKDAVFYHQNLTWQISTCLCTCYSLSVQINSVKSLPYMCIWTYKSKNFIPGKRLYAVCSCFTIVDDMTSAYGVYKFWLSSGQKTTVHVMLINET